MNKFLATIRAYFIKKMIALKNHVNKIPLFMAGVSLIVITFTMFVFTDAIFYMPYNNINAFFYFVLVLASILSVVSYMKATAKHGSKKMTIIMMVVFYVLVAGQIVLDILYIRDVGAEIVRLPELGERWQIPLSRTWSYVHIICLAVTAVLAAAAPFVQPFFKKIQLSVEPKQKVKDEESESAE